MSRKIILVGLAILLSLNVAVFLIRMRSGSDWGDQLASAREKETSLIASGLRRQQGLLARDYIADIGALVKSRAWAKKTPIGLSKAQSDAIVQLDDLLRDLRVFSWTSDADYLDGNPADYQQYLDRSRSRLGSAIRHAQRMVSLGLLSEAQAQLVLSDNLLAKRSLFSLMDSDVQELLGMTSDQKAAVNKVERDSRSRYARLQSSMVGSDDLEKLTAQMSAIDHEIDEAALAVLTANQRELWFRLTSKQNHPAGSPNLPSLSAADTASIKIDDQSPVLRTISRRAGELKLSDQQKRFINDLQDVARKGVAWIDSKPLPADQKANSRSKFIKHAEQVALLGILNQQQAKQVQATIN